MLIRKVKQSKLSNIFLQKYIFQGTYFYFFIKMHRTTILEVINFLFDSFRDKLLQFIPYLV